MVTVRIILLGLSLLHYILNEAFWQADFYWFFIWVIAYQILWFYLESTTLRKIMFGLLLILAVINTVILPQLPILMLGLLVLDIREQFNRQTSGFILGGLVLAFLGSWHFTNDSPSWHEVAVLLGVLFLCAWVTEQFLLMKRREQERYERISEQTELENKTNLLKGQMNTMEEIYTLNERNRISRDLHDSIGHTLSTIVIQLAAIEKLTADSNPKASKMLNHLHGFTKEGLANVREVIHEIKPANYKQIAFVDKVHNLVTEFESNSDIQVYFNTNEAKWALNEKQEELIYRAVQEFLGNTVKHSSATEVRIQYHFTTESVILTMQDNGEGTDEVRPQMGLTGMEERANLLKGKIQIQTASGSGFKVRIVLPKGGVMDGEN